MDTFVCPKGHPSTEGDYCSECGARIVPLPVASAPVEPPPVAMIHPGAQVESCPACGAQREKSELVFCEVCGANFSAAPPISPPASASAEPVPPPFVPNAAPVLTPIILPAPDQAAAESAPQQWEVTVSVDPALRHPASPDAPVDYVPYTVALTEPVSLVGRRSEARAIFPQIALQHDDAVSHRHALLQIDPAGMLEIRDIGSSNGTRLNGVEMQQMRDYPLHPGDEVAVGHWTRLTVGARAAVARKGSIA
jgi:hypothetical protein